MKKVGFILAVVFATITLASVVLRTFEIPYVSDIVALLMILMSGIMIMLFLGTEKEIKNVLDDKDTKIYHLDNSYKLLVMQSNKRIKEYERQVTDYEARIKQEIDTVYATNELLDQKKKQLADVNTKYKECLYEYQECIDENKALNARIELLSKELSMYQEVDRIPSITKEQKESKKRGPYKKKTNYGNE